MKHIIALFASMLLVAGGSLAQINKSELTYEWNESDELLIPENGPPPPETSVDASRYFLRLRLQDKRNFPVLEICFQDENRFKQFDLTDFRAAGLYKLPIKGLFFKGLFVSKNPQNGGSQEFYASYLMGKINKLGFAVGLDIKEVTGDDIHLLSARAKYQLGVLTAMGGVSSNPDDIDRYTLGGLLDLPGQVMLGGLAGFWENDKGYVLNLGRYNNRGDFGGLPSFSINYLEVPNTYKWSNFRIMWGDAGTHYVRPTFDNPVFSGQLDLDAALMLSQLIPDNYRYFDSPLLFLRYDEYGKIALRMNYIETSFALRKFDTNLSINPGWSYGILESNRAILTFERLHNPAFGWQDNRYHLSIATYILGKIYTGFTWSDDFENYTNLKLELRYQIFI